MTTKRPSPVPNSPPLVPRLKVGTNVLRAATLLALGTACASSDGDDRDETADEISMGAGGADAPQLAPTGGAPQTFPQVPPTGGFGGAPQPFPGSGGVPGTGGVQVFPQLPPWTGGAAGAPQVFPGGGAPQAQPAGGAPQVPPQVPPQAPPSGGDGNE